MNNYQKYFNEGRGEWKMLEIARLFHPGIDLSTIYMTFKYDWACIRDKKGHLDLALNFDHSFWGPRITLLQFQEHVRGDHWRMWRFVGDSKYDALHSKTPKFQSLLKGIPKPTAQEMYDYYYE